MSPETAILDAAADNLIQVEHNHDPFSGAISDKHAKAGRASALIHRGESDRALIDALAAHDGNLTVPQLSQSIGLSAPCTCVRLAALERKGLVCGPHCNARKRWDLTLAGRALAGTTQPVLDDRDRDLLSALAQASMGHMRLARWIAVSPMTAKRRARLLVTKGLVSADMRGFFSITAAGRQALGDTTPPKIEPWVKPSAISAAAARDVVERAEHRPHDDRTMAQRSEHGRMARLREPNRAPADRSAPFNQFRELDMTG